MRNILSGSESPILLANFGFCRPATFSRAIADGAAYSATLVCSSTLIPTQGHLQILLQG